MPEPSATPAELHHLGRWVTAARDQQSLTQRELASRAGMAQSRVADVETGRVLPTLPQLVRLAHALDKPLQWFLSGHVRPGLGVTDLAVPLRWLGVVDLLVPDAVVPGAFLPTEQVLAAAVRPRQPDPRIVEALPAVLAWNRWSPSRLREFSRPRRSRSSVRLAWLADVALTIHRTTGFPGGCPRPKSLEDFVASLARAKLPLTPDDLGRPGEAKSLPPVAKRWRITYDAPLSAFAERAAHLHSLRPGWPSAPEATRPDDE